MDGLVLNAAHFGVHQSNEPRANTPALNAAFAVAAAQGLDCHLPAGTLRHDGPLIWPGTVRLAGRSADTILQATDSGFTGLTVQGAPDRRVGPNGYIRDLRIAGPGGNSAKPVADGHAALRLSRAVQVTVDRVDVTGYDIGFDLTHNCYGSEFRNCRALFGSNNVGANLRTGTQSGSDIAFYNCWLSGQAAGVHISGDGGGYHFHGGQFGCGNQPGSTADHNRAAIVAGKDYLTGKVGACSLDLWGVSFEGTNYGWAVATWDQVRMVASACSFNPPQTARPAIGALRMTDPKHSQVSLVDSTISGEWSGENLIERAGTTWSAFAIREVGTYTAPRRPTIAGEQQMVPSMLAQSGLDTA